jgi:hypothetical protein
LHVKNCWFFFFKQNNTNKRKQFSKTFYASFAALFLPAAKVDYDNSWEKVLKTNTTLNGKMKMKTVLVPNSNRDVLLYIINGWLMSMSYYMCTAVHCSTINPKAILRCADGSLPFSGK